MKTFYYLSSCDSCKRILKTLELPPEIKLVDLKKHPLSVIELTHLYSQTESYEALLNKRAQKLKGIDKATLTEDQIKALLLEHYTYVKRPILDLQGQLFIGNAKTTVEAAKIALHG